MDYKEDETYDRPKHTKFVKTNNDFKHCEYIDGKFIKSIKGTLYRYTLNSTSFMVEFNGLAYIHFQNKFYYNTSKNSFLQLANECDKLAKKIKTPEGINLYGYRVNGLFDDEFINSKMIERNYYNEDVSECCQNPVRAELKNIKRFDIGEDEDFEYITKDNGYSIIITKYDIYYPLLENRKRFFTPIKGFKPCFSNMTGKKYNEEYEEEYYEDENNKNDENSENEIQFYFPLEMEALNEEYKNAINEILNELLDTDTPYEYKIHVWTLYIDSPYYFKNIILLAYYNGVYDTLSEYINEFEDYEMINKYTKYSQEVFKENGIEHE